MKKIFYLIGPLLVFITLNPFSCVLIEFLNDPDPLGLGPDHVAETSMWTVSGTTIFNGTPDAGTTIKLAAFYDGTKIVSNVVTVNDGGAFSLDINVSEMEPTENDEIYLRMWEDDNLDDLRDYGETNYDLEPAPGDCPVFGYARDAGDDSFFSFVSDCSFLWMVEGSGCDESTNGWNVERSGIFGDESVTTADLTGARITNKDSF